MRRFTLHKAMHLIAPRTGKPMALTIALWAINCLPLGAMADISTDQPTPLPMNLSDRSIMAAGILDRGRVMERSVGSHASDLAGTLPVRSPAQAIDARQPANPSETILVSTPQDTDPKRQLPSSPIEPPPSVSPPPAPKPKSPNFVLENLQTNIRIENDRFNPGQRQKLFEQTAQFRLSDRDKLLITTGINFYDQPNFKTITNVPLQFIWERKLDPFTLQIGAGADFFDRLPTVPNLFFKLDAPLFPGVGVSAVVEQRAIKPNAKTIDNEITGFRFGPNLYWQIDPDSYFFTFFRFGNYSDSNQEFVAYSRLERKFGQFFVATSLFVLSFQKDLDSGYFSPPDFLIYNGEVGFETDITRHLRCRLAGSLGQQRLEGKYTLDKNLQTRCRVQFSPTVDADLGYNIGDQSFTAQFRARF